ncbi:MAG: M15 family metallopeptidase [Clostridia bacterium]|nr:M15 family metallopeptidase [Clostridia bacterium]
MRRKNSPFLIPLIVVAVITLILTVILLIPDGGGEKTPEGKPPEKNDPVTEIKVPEVTFKSSLEEYEKYMNAKDEKYLVLVNKEHIVGVDFEPADRIDVKDTPKNGITLERTAAKALEAMFAEMRANGFNNVFVTSAYRSYDYQKDTYNGWVNYEMQSITSDARKVLGDGYIYEKYTSKGKSGLDRTDAERVADSYSARPGTSEHQTGLCVDLMTSTMSALDESFADYPVYDWLLENAWKFGFVLRFPEDKTEITGYSFEPWHYRFVGREHAYKMYSRGVCLEEYVKSLK